MPPLPAGADAAASAPPDTALAFALEVARTAGLRDSPPPDDVRALFTRSLAQLIRAALAPEGGDAAFQALALRTSDAEVDAYVRLVEQSNADRRTVRALVNGLAHPARLHALAPGPLHDALAQLHQLASAQAWAEVADTMRLLLLEPFLQDDALREALQAALAGEALQRLLRAGAALQHAGVRRYRVLREQHGPAAGSQAAAQQGRAAARAGELAERAAAQALGGVAALLERHTGRAPPAGWRVVRNLRTPPGFPGDADKAKDEWDAAIVCGGETDGDGAAHGIVLLAEVKAAPAAATPDFARLLRGLERLALADPDARYTFACADGQLRLRGASLRRLRPDGRALPPHVVYCCCAAAELQPAMLSAGSKAVLLAEPASLAWAHRLARGEAPPHTELTPVWEALAVEPRLRAALHQYDTARAVREAMLHPDDLLETVARLAGG